MLRKVGGFFAGYICFSAGFGFFISLGALFEKGQDSFGIFLGSAIFLGVVSWQSFKLSRKLFTDPALVPVDDPRTAEQIILDLAAATDGTLTIGEIAARTRLSVAEAKDGVEALTREGVAAVEFDEKQDVYYRFPGLDG